MPEVRCAIYARVSTRDKGQDPENQLEQLREYCRRQGWTITGEYIDHETAKHGNRDAFKRLFDDASRREFDVLVVWALDRLTREGVWETFAYVRKQGSVFSVPAGTAVKIMARNVGLIQVRILESAMAGRDGWIHPGQLVFRRQR